MSTYETLQYVAAFWGTAYFAAIFAIAVFQALRPSKRADYDAAARIPLTED